MKFNTCTFKCLRICCSLFFALLGGISAARTPRWFTPTQGLDPVASLPMEQQAQDDDWRFGPNLDLVHDENLGRKVWEHSGGRNGHISYTLPLPETFVVEAKVRVMEDGHGAALCAGEGHDEWEISLVPRRHRGAPLMRVSTSRSRRDHYLEDASLSVSAARDSLPSALPSIPNRVDFGYRFTEAPSPLSDGVYRREIEAALTAQAARGEYTERWHALRIESRPGRLRMYVNGVPAGESSAVAAVSGGAVLRLDRSVRVADLRIRPLDRNTGSYYPVDITRRFNARAAGGGEAAALVEGNLPGPGVLGEVEGIPFQFDRDHMGNDHVDMSFSLFRERNLFRHRGAVTRFLWPDPSRYDPSRITFSVPNRAYTRLWVVAAFDETPHSVPVLTARFYKPGRGFPVDAAVAIPGAGARRAAGEAVRLPVDAEDGTERSLWLVPIDLDAGRLAAEMREMESLSLELTKQVHPFRAYPDPHNFGWFQGGPPSGVRILAMTLEEAPVHMVASGNRHGNVYVEPEQPLWQVDLNNQRAETVSGRVRLMITDPYGEPAGEEEKSFDLTANGAVRLEIPLKPGCYGLHTVHTEVEVESPEESVDGGILRRLFRRTTAQSISLARKGAFVQLPPDTRRTSMEDSPWGLACWHGAHDTHPVLEDDFYLLRAAGARGGGNPSAKDDMVQTWGLRPRARHIGNDQRTAQPWAFEDPYDPEKYEANRDLIGRRIADRSEDNAHVPSWSMFIETAITAHLTYGVPRRWIGKDPTWTEEEERRVRAFMIYGRAVCEGIRKHAPDAPIALGWAASTFPIPLLKSGFPRKLFDYIGVDDPVFARTPEMPIRDVTFNRLWLLRQAMEEYGYDDVPVIHVESYFPSGNPLSLGWRRQADHYIRLSLLARSIIPETKFSGVLSLQDCASYWGSQHYGEVGMISRQPEANPKPAFVAYATMTRLLDPGEYQGWLETGSHSDYCLHFTSNEKHVYPMWTLRGRRAASLRLPEEAAVAMVDESGNTFELDVENGWIAVSLTPTVLWVVSDMPVDKVVLSETDHSFVREDPPLMAHGFADGDNVARYRPENKVAPGEYALLLDSMERPWNYVSGPYPEYAENAWHDFLRAPRHDGPMRSEQVHSDRFDVPVWEIELQEPDIQRELTAWYGVFEPDEPIEIPGRARALGVWADGRSNWGRIVYELEDAAGQIWRSIGMKDSHNCDDVHTWSYFNFDGWRYIEFPLPSHLPYDNYREHDTTWWGTGRGDAVVELPLRLRRIIIEHRTHNVYVDAMVETPDRSVRLHRLKAVYEDADSMTEAPVERQREMAGLLREKRDVEAPALPNPIAELHESGIGKATEFVDLSPPDDYDGLVTRLEIEVEPVDNARKYRIYVAAYEDGRGAERIAEGEEAILEVARLQPGVELYLFATYIDKDGNESRPTAARRILLVDDFPFR